MVDSRWTELAGLNQVHHVRVGLRFCKGLQGLGCLSVYSLQSLSKLEPLEVKLCPLLARDDVFYGRCFHSTCLGLAISRHHFLVLQCIRVVFKEHPRLATSIQCTGPIESAGVTAEVSTDKWALCRSNARHVGREILVVGFSGETSQCCPSRAVNDLRKIERFALFPALLLFLALAGNFTQLVFDLLTSFQKRCSSCLGTLQSLLCQCYLLRKHSQDLFLQSRSPALEGQHTRNSGRHV
mmetsp:Transcript_119499/g.283705  ORF Transcript_119499/g.283705 Transcript_119499/m.283705 type:complete len:239 (-) Transcript_119499:341-1057(-)